MGVVGWEANGNHASNQMSGKYLASVYPASRGASSRFWGLFKDIKKRFWISLFQYFEIFENLPNIEIFYGFGSSTQEKKSIRIGRKSSLNESSKPIMRKPFETAYKLLLLS